MDYIVFKHPFVMNSVCVGGGAVEDADPSLKSEAIGFTSAAG